MDPKKKAILERTEMLESDMSKGREYLESGAHADWHGFRAYFAAKTKDGKAFRHNRLSFSQLGLLRSASCGTP